jgi:hypothetical protein
MQSRQSRCNHPAARLQESDIPKIRALHRAGIGGRTIARRFGCGERTIYDILQGKTWIHVKP